MFLNEIIKPRIDLYHGTGNTQFTEFNTPIVWFSFTPEIANDYANIKQTLYNNSFVIKAYINYDQLRYFIDTSSFPETMTIRMFLNKCYKRRIKKNIDVIKLKELVDKIKEQYDIDNEYRLPVFWRRNSNLLSIVKDFFDIIKMKGIIFNEGQKTIGIFDQSIINY